VVELAELLLGVMRALDALTFNLAKFSFGIFCIAQTLFDAFNIFPVILDYIVYLP
jgi:hypothetical protein